MRKPFIAGNWKMNTTSTSAAALARGLSSQLAGIASVDVAVCPPFVYLQSVAAALSASNIALGAQDVYFEGNGAFTGEISVEMLKDCSCTYVIIGHSERRHILGETDGLINKKIAAAIAGGLLPIFCVGELLQEREAGKTTAVVAEQVKKGLDGLCSERVQAVTIAYEPVWAIGTGRTATPAQAQEVHLMIRNLLAQLYGGDIAQSMRIQYGGSAKPSNTAELMSQPDVDGLLVGGASLKVEDFAAMVKTVA
ncbi:MAG TPA: triose-phosphate isomerase [Anaerohalosphaeraceae bacterium]|nr:triose-phosphate isomerase [Phycisphaerae bacterium]HOK96446.1 triose-phosphate isomerase [Anaerohalosphaeraceae bacterium]HOM76572.1 triose-phosphate isomerase [Anaerohalosphaeraceae bacterium]HPC64970.1 triose-phosphate isomerase [Anaerohalosphaeraceae bacterium]HPO70808.1 triose-phosphate isomerase [Anaerohalosphaeraceae bacterium]